MYRSDLRATDKGGAIAAVVAIHVVLFFMLLNLSGRMDIANPQRALRVFDVTEIPPPPPEPTVQPQTEQRTKPKATEGAASPKNIKSTATEVVAPRPEFSMPVPVPMAATRTPNAGVQPTQGASDVAGPGTGAGGSGTGTGSGGSGSGTGGGGGGAVSPPRLATPVLTGRDFPREMLDQWPRRATVFLRLRVDPRGFVSECNVDRGTGIGAIDSQICNVAHERLRFRPALNKAGAPVAGWFGYAQPAPR